MSALRKRKERKSAMNAEKKEMTSTMMKRDNSAAGAMNVITAFDVCRTNCLGCFIKGEAFYYDKDGNRHLH